jgi:hypothetical protein
VIQLVTGLLNHVSVKVGTPHLTPSSALTPLFFATFIFLLTPLSSLEKWIKTDQAASGVLK